jgi:UDP-glucose:(heptosyl)LPS alpha-1,3-glucosyltransferase
MKRVVLLKSHSSSQGGLEKHTSRIAKAFLDRGFPVTLLTTGKPPSSTPFPVYGANLRKWPSFIKIEQFDAFCQKWVRENGADIIFGMDRNRVQTHMRAGNGVHAAYLDSRTPVEGCFKSLLCKINPLHRKILSIEKQAFENKSLKTIFTNSHLVKEQITKYYNVDPQKIKVVHNGVEWEEMSEPFSLWQEKKSSICQVFQLNPDHFHFLFIGNGFLRKGLDRLLLALSLLDRKDVHLSVVGKDKFLEVYKTKAISLGLKNQVRFFGPVPNVNPFYQFADALAIPSFYDPFANVTVEALAMGLFVVSSKQNGGSEVITEQNGMVVDHFDIEKLIQALQQAINHKKTAESAIQIRTGVKHLDFAKQLNTLIDLSLKSVS